MYVFFANNIMIYKEYIQKYGPKTIAFYQYGDFYDFMRSNKEECTYI